VAGPEVAVNGSAAARSGRRALRRPAWAAAVALSGALLVGGAVAATAAPTQTVAPTVTVSGAAQFRAAGQTYSVSLDVRGTAAGGSGRCALAGGGLAVSCTGISSVTRGTGAAADSATVVGTVRTSRGQNVPFRAVVADRANPNGAGRDAITATVEGRTVQGTVTNGNLVVTGTTPAPAPQANPDVGTASPGRPATGNVLDNDVPGPGSLVVKDPGTYLGQYGTLALERDGRYTYTLGDGPVGTDVADLFTYTAVDAQGRESTSTITVNISNPPA
jgi:VCBS repeat-containing protein